ncbi:MAG: thioesterase family protein [Microthrixaceae bacterium]|nr:thioesterase family protein [Microthrixaceae bacterium]
MTTPNILTDTTPVIDPDAPQSPSCVITDAWGLLYAQGGVVMAAALRSMELVLDRPELSLASASATFCRPVACGPVRTDVDVVRSGRRGAQVTGSLREGSRDPGSANVVVTAVFTDPTMEGPLRTPVPCPDELSTPANAVGPSISEEVGSRFPLGFLDNTEWRVAVPPSGQPGDAGPVPRAALWFRFNDQPSPSGSAWDPALLPIPGDSLGSALYVALGEGARPVGSVSLQIDLQVLAPMTGTWIGIDSTCTHVGAGLARGVLHLWSESGTHVATVMQTAMLRSFDG